MLKLLIIISLLLSGLNAGSASAMIVRDTGTSLYRVETGGETGDTEFDEEKEVTEGVKIKSEESESDTEIIYEEDEGYWIQRLKIVEYNFLVIKEKLGKDVYKEALEAIADEMNNINIERSYGYASDYVRVEEGVYKFYIVIEGYDVCELTCDEDHVISFERLNNFTESNFNDLYLDWKYSTEEESEVSINKEDFEDVKNIYGFLNTDAYNYVMDFLKNKGVYEKSFYIGLVEEVVKAELIYD